VPDFGSLSTVVEISPDAAMSEPKFVLPGLAEAKPKGGLRLLSPWASYSAWFALGLAALAGLSLNIMPCVWPVLPLIVMRIVEQAKQDKSKSMTMGLAFCFGILLFFACLAAANIVLQVFYGTVLQWGDPFRNPVILMGLVLLLVVLALFMFGVFTITVPVSISGKSSSRKGLGGAVGMGFLAAILSTPCGFGVLAAAFGWAQVQPLFLASVAIMVMGVGMALPYAVLTLMPGLLESLPGPGRWMEIFKQAVGFILLFIAVWLIAALPQGLRMNVLYFGVVLSFCVWMWAGWVTYKTKLLHKYIIRVAATAMALFAALTFLIEPIPSAPPINWQPYDANLIETAIAEKRPVLIKFTADWCLSCKFVEIAVYSQEEINRLVDQKNVLAIKADTTVRDYPATMALKEVYGEPGVPVSILFLPGERQAHRWRGKSFAGELKELLEELPSK